VRRRSTLTLAACFVALLSFLPAAAAYGFGESAVPAAKGLAIDCAAGASLTPGSKHEVDWVIWCGPIHGRFEVDLHPTKKAGPIALAGAPTMSGPGAGATPACGPKGDEVRCRVRKSGPITVRGSFRVAGDPCAERVDVWIQAGRRSGEGIGRKPWGCPHSKPPAPPTMASIVRFYLAERLGPGLTGNRAGVKRTARRERQAWIDEAPTERWAAQAWGAPVDPAGAEELTLRLTSIEQAGRLIESWVHDHQLGSIYAGWYWGPEGSIYVGFIQEPESNLKRMKAAEPFIAPARVQPFPTPPTNSENELNALLEKILDATENLDEPNYGLVGIGLDVPANQVEVEAEHTVATRRLLTELFGAEAPVEVVKGRPGELL
jgi:hypothetical protein